MRIGYTLPRCLVTQPGTSVLKTALQLAVLKQRHRNKKGSYAQEAEKSCNIGDCRQEY
jgi:hypothetical protein